MFESFASLQFLRPLWFLALIPLIWLLYLGWQKQLKQGAWQQVIAPQFRQLLLGNNAELQPKVNEKIFYSGLGFIWFITVLALAGPWLKAVEVPAQKSQQGVVIVLDLSLSMLADDVSPNRLARVKYTLTDLLKQHPEYATGMVAYAGSAHTISPISEDNQTLLNLLPSLNPLLMPSYGAKPLPAFEKAKQLFMGNQTNQGHIIWITDDIEKHEVNDISTWLEKESYSLTMLSIGTTEGGAVQIPGYGLLKDENDAVVLPKIPVQEFQTLANKTDIKWLQFDPHVDIVQALLPAENIIESHEDNDESEQQKQVQHPLDIGFYFIFLILPFVALLFRRGILLSLSLVALLPMSLLQPTPSYANETATNSSRFSELFKSTDQLGYQAWQKDQYAKAEALFADPQWRASALYRQGKYQEAAELYKKDKSPQGLYNLGNALSMNEQLEEAKKAYESALNLRPYLKNAKDNLKTVNDLLKQKEQQSQQNKTNNQQNQSQKNKNDSQNKTSEQTGMQNPQNGDTANNNAENQQPQMPESSKQEKQSGQADKTEQAKNQQNKSEQKEKQDRASQQDISENKEGKSAKPDDGQTAQPNKIDSGDESQTAAANAQQPLTEEQQAKQNWLKQIPDEPGLFLQRKFEYQYQQSKQQANESTKQW